LREKIAMVLFGVFCLALGMLVHLVIDKADDDPRGDYKTSGVSVMQGRVRGLVVADGVTAPNAETDHSLSKRFLAKERES
jgi:hypothetical protein